MDDLNEELVDGGAEIGRQEDGTKDDDVDIYQDLPDENETMVKESDANFNVIERFNRLLDPKRRKADDFDAENASEEDVDLYDDLNTFENQLVAEELQAKVEILEKKCSSLDSKNAELKAELEKVNKINLSLRRNISSVFKTAKAELDRKDRQLKDLQRQHDSLLFKRGAANNRIIPHNVDTPTTNTNPSPDNISTDSSPANISTAPPTKISLLRPEYMVNPSQNPTKSKSTLPSFHELTKDSEKGNLITIENETECTFKMGPITLSFMSESLDFQKRRFERIGKDDGIELDPRFSKGKVNGNPSSEKVSETSRVPAELLEERANLLKQLSIANEALEDGEFTEETTAVADRKKQEESRETSRRKDDSRLRSRSSSRSHGFIDGKRKRSSSNERLKSRNSHERGPSRRSQRSPAKSSRHRNSGNSHYNKSHSNRR
uniref:Uncharacterized protein n=1 Tax=Daphnia galeata TaxID=27404 RepID=A0A8J2WLX6_9CRUS|nr:unnamed protein product [Daphnia galeata]